MKLVRIVKVFSVVLLFVAPAVRAQQQQPPNATQGGTPTSLSPLPPEANDAADNANPTAAARGLFLGSNDSTSGTSQAVPDTHVLSDSEAFGLGQLQGPHNVFSPSLFFAEGGDTGINPGITTAFTLLGGSLTLERFWSRYDFRLAYDGGETIYIPYGNPNRYSYHNLGISQTVRWQRWTLNLNNALTYSPQTTFGGLNLGGPGLQPFQLPTALEPSASPTQGILTNYAPRLQEALAGDLDYQLSPHGTLTFSGSGGLLHFTVPVPSYIDSTFYSGRIGYNYSFNSKDSIAVTDVFIEDKFSGYSNFERDDSVLVSYGRKVTGRMALQVGVGPQYLDLLYFVPSPSIVEWLWTAFASLTYHWQRTDLAASYSHALSNGAGLYFGSEADSVLGSLSHRFTPVWSGSVYTGYTLNKNPVSTPGISNQFYLFTGGANLTRNLGRSVDVIFGYGFMWQNASAGSCPIAAGCGALDYTRSIGSVTVNWHMVPVRFE